MAHKKFIDSVMKHGQVTIKDLDEFLRFTLCDYEMQCASSWNPLTRTGTSMFCL